MGGQLRFIGLRVWVLGFWFWTLRNSGFGLVQRSRDKEAGVIRRSHEADILHVRTFRNSCAGPCLRRVRGRFPKLL